MLSTVATAFLVLYFHAMEGRIAFIKGDRVLMVANHRVVRERITEDVEVVEMINEIIPYNGKALGWSNRHYLRNLVERYRYNRVLAGRFCYAGVTLVRLEVWDQDR